jgi:hypothetical protein
MAARKYTKEQLDYLRLRARQGVTNAEHGIPKEEEGLSEDELDDLISELQRTSNSSYQRELIGVIYYAGFPERERHRKILEPFFRDPYHATEMLTILCREWDLTAHYKQELREFIRGAPWDRYANDPIGWCQQMAVDLVFEKWTKLTDPTLLREVITLYENNRDNSRGRNPRDASYWSLWRLLGSPFVTEAETIELAKELTSQLESASESDRGVVSSAFISALQPERSVDDYIIALHHENPTVKIRAARTLASIGGQRALGPLIDAMYETGENVFVRQALLGSVADFGPDGVQPIINILVDKSQDESLRRAAAVSLGKHGDDRALQALIVLCEDKAAMLGENGYSLLGYAVSDAIDALRTRLDVE